MEFSSGDGGGESEAPARKLKRGKMRSAWIAFVGRIVAQVVGSVATIVLGVLLLQRSQQWQHPPPDPVKPAPASSRVRSASARTSIAVLPLANYSGDKSVDDFADGMTDAIIADLARVDTLRVISRTSIMQYKGGRKPLWEIARELDVDLIVEGSIVRTGSRMRLTAQLIDAGSDEHRWAKSYERTIRDVLAAQADLARTIAADVEAVAGAPLSSRSGAAGRPAHRAATPARIPRRARRRASAPAA